MLGMLYLDEIDNYSLIHGAATVLHQLRKWRTTLEKEAS